MSKRPGGTTRADHGTRTRYSWGCRCDECRAANTAGQRAYHRRRSINPDAPKDPVKVRAGLASAKVRWGDGPARMLRARDYTPDQWASIIAYAESKR